MLNEHDINDMCALYELRSGTKFKLDPDEQVKLPPASDVFNIEDVFTLRNIDGMYSYCLDSKGGVHHFAAWTKVIKLTEQS